MALPCLTSQVSCLRTIYVSWSYADLKIWSFVLRQPQVFLLCDTPTPILTQPMVGPAVLRTIFQSIDSGGGVRWDLKAQDCFLTWHITACALLVRHTGFYRDSLSESVLAFRCALSWKQFCLGSIIFDRWIYFMFYRSAWWVASDEIISLFRHWLFIVPRYFPYWLLTAVHTLSLVLVWHRSGECLHHSRCIFGTQWQILSDASYPNLWIAQLDLLIHELELRDKSYEK